MNDTVFTGCATALITPFDEYGDNVDYASFEKLIGIQLENNVDALVVAGTTGEAPVLTSDEKSELLRIAKSNSGTIPIIAGTGSNNTTEAVKKSNEAEKQGVNGLLIVTPYYNKCTQDGIIEHYDYIAERVSAPIIVYNVPARTGVHIKPETYKALAQIKKVTAIKEASGNISDYNIAQSMNEQLCFYSGNDDLTVSMMSYGAKGVISVASNIIPGIIKRITDLCLADRFTEAADMHKKYLSLMNSLFCEVNPAPVKFASGLLYDFQNSLRLPLMRVSKFNEGIIKEQLEKFNLLK